MDNVLVVATTSYAGMGPYVSEIINSFSSQDNMYFILREYEDGFYKKNIKESLQNRCFYYKKVNSNINKLIELFVSDSIFDNYIISICVEKSIRVVHYINTPAPIDITNKLKQIGITSIGTVHDLHPHESKKALHKMFRAKISWNRVMRNINYSKYLITNSRTQLKELTDIYPDKKIYFHDFPSLVTERIKEGSMVPDEMSEIKKPYILFFGRIEEYKGIKYLYNAYLSDSRIFNEYNLIIAGNGEPNIDRQRDEKGVIFINRYIKDEEIKALYENARCVVYPYISATQSGVLSLAYYFNVPTITSDVQFFRDIVNNTGAGIVFENSNVSDLREKLIHVLESDNSQMIANEIKYYDENYDSSVIRERLLSIYESARNDFMTV